MGTASSLSNDTFFVSKHEQTSLLA